jgi:AcrR family transcriptional regulator
MSRWEPGTADRLRLAALELFVEQGYDATTVDDVVGRVGVTQRTFFRHFVDKEEVLFDADAVMQDVLVGAARTCAREHGGGTGRGLVIARAATAALARSFEADRDRHRTRWRVLRQVPALQGRQLVKQERWAAALCVELVTAGVPDGEAAIAVEIASGSLRLAYAEWLGSTRPRRLHTVLSQLDAQFDEVVGAGEESTLARR